MAVPVDPGAGDTRLTAAGRDDQRAVIADHPRFAVAHALLNAVGPGCGARCISQ
jgi:hypothetical protein